MSAYSARRLAGVALVNPATSIGRSWPAQLPRLLDAVAALPPNLSDAAYFALATPIFAAVSGDPPVRRPLVW